MAPNPPDGALIDYVVGPRAASSSVEIAIFDAGGAPVVHYASTDPVTHPDLATIGAAPEWIPVSVPPAASPGEHRFVWNLHYAKAAGIGGRDQGVWAPPGRYRVDLTVGGQHFEAPLDVLPDPRVKVTPAEFQAEFDMARQVEAQRVRVRAALAQAARIKGILLGQITDAGPTDRTDLEDLVRHLDVITDLSVGEPPAYAATRSPAGLRDISERLDTLASAIDGADGAPTSDAITGFREARRALDAAEARLAAFQKSVAPAR